MIREAQGKDVERIVEMGSRSLREGAYKDQLGDNPDVTRKLAQNILKNHVGTILVAEEDDKAIALLAMLFYPHPYSGEPIASEIMWYVEPEYRQSFTALALLRAGERLARAKGAKRMQFTAPTSDVGKAYESLGYKPIEVSYQKTL